MLNAFFSLSPEVSVYECDRTSCFVTVGANVVQSGQQFGRYTKKRFVDNPLEKKFIW